MAKEVIKKGFKFSDRFNNNEKGKIQRIIGYELKKGNTQTNIIQILKEKGYSYWEKNMAYDIRRKEAILYAKSSSAKKDAGDWYDKTFEIFRSKYKLTSRQANKVWKKTKENAIMKMLQAENEKEFWDLYKGLTE